MAAMAGELEADAEAEVRPWPWPTIASVAQGQQPVAVHDVVAA
jgi:hypothetical protein